jgi:hypothetical protein
VENQQAMKANHEVIKETVQEFLRSQSSDTIARYINDAITMHRVQLKMYASIGYKTEVETDQEAFAYIALAEPSGPQHLELTGFKCIDDQINFKQKVHLILEKDAFVIQTLLCVLYTNIVEALVV